MDNLPRFNESTALSLLESREDFPIDFDLAWEWLGFSRKDNAKVSLLDCGFIQGIDLLINQELGTLANLRPEEKIQLTVDCFKTWGMMANTEQGKQVRLYFLQCERKMKQFAQSLSDKKPKSLLNLESIELYALMGYLLALECEAMPNFKSVEHIDSCYFAATLDAVQYAYHKKQCRVAEVTKSTNDIMREVGWMPIDQKEIDKENKNIVEFAKYLALLETGKLGEIRKTDFDRFESQQAAIASGENVRMHEIGSASN